MRRRKKGETSHPKKKTFLISDLVFIKKDPLPALMNGEIKSHIIQSAKLLGLSYQHMPSGAGHDSQEMATIAPVGMIFFPSAGGISHSPKEFTSATDMANGANVLLQTILAIDNK